MWKPERWAFRRLCVLPDVNCAFDRRFEADRNLLFSARPGLTVFVYCSPHWLIASITGAVLFPISVSGCSILGGTLAYGGTGGNGVMLALISLKPIRVHRQRLCQ